MATRARPAPAPAPDRLDRHEGAFSRRDQLPNGRTYMNMLRQAPLRFLAAVALVASAAPASATLLDHGPQDPTLVFPTWYRDLNGLAVKECLSTTPSPNAGAAGKPMGFPLNPDPAGLPRHGGPPIFFNVLKVRPAQGG